MIKLNINEIFYSIQGESSRVGLPTVFVRLTGCPLRCNYCDTEYAFKGNNIQTITQILKTVSSHHTPFVCVTGGEPLAQKNCPALLDALVNKGYQVSLETSGSIDISAVNDDVMIVMDVKTPASGEEKNNLLSNIKLLKPKDEVKFVIANKTDFNWSVEFLNQHHFNCQILFSPITERLKPAQLAKWILDKQLNVKLQLQLHKILWGNKLGV